MILSESQLRKIIREEIIKESFLTSAEEGVKSVQIANKNYSTIGFTKAQEKFYLVIHAPKADEQAIKKVGGQMIKHEEVKLQNSETSPQTHTQKNFGFGNAKVKNIFYAIPTKSDQIKYTKEILKTGAASYADYSVEIAGIFGGIPGIGEPIDVAGGVIAMLKDPPEYLIAAFSFICAIPAAGTAIALLKPGVKEIAEEVAEEGIELGAKKIGAYISKNADINFDSSTVKKIQEGGEKIINAVKDSEITNQIAKKVGKSEQEVKVAFEETEKVFKGIMEGFEDVGANQGGKALGKGTKEALEKQTKEQLDVVVKSLKTGKLREIAEESMFKVRALVEEKEQLFVTNWFKATEEAAKKGNVVKTFQDTMGFLQDYSENIIGKKFTLPDPPGGSVVYRNFDDFRNSLFKIASLHGVKISDILVPTVLNTVKNRKPFMLPTKENVDKLISMTIDKMTNIKYRAVSDTSIVSKSADAGGLEMVDAGRGSITYGYSTNRGSEIVINTAAFDGGIEGGRVLEQMRETIQEEFIHSADSMLISTLSMGDEFVARIIRKANINMASETLAKRAWDPDGAGINITRELLSDTFNFIDPSVTGKRITDYVLGTPNGPVVEGGRMIADRLDDAAKRLSEKHKIPLFHAYALTNEFAKYSNYYSGLSKQECEKTIHRFLGYHGNPQEFFAKMENLKIAIKKSGVEEVGLEEIYNFFIKYDTFEELGKDVPKIKNNSFFESIYDLVTVGGPNASKEMFRVLASYT